MDCVGCGKKSMDWEESIGVFCFSCWEEKRKEMKVCEELDRIQELSVK